MSINVIPIVKSEGGAPELCQACRSSRWIERGGGVDIFRTVVTEHVSCLKLCYSCTVNLHAMLGAQIAFLHGERYRKQI